MTTNFQLLALACVVAILSACQTEEYTPREYSGGQEEGHFTDRGSRKWFEFNRLKDPATGVIPAGIRGKELQFADRLPDNMERADWNSRGPINKGGRTRALAYDTRDENIILAGSVTGGMWRSADGGVSFTKTTDPSYLQSVNCIIQDSRPGQEDTWYYGSGEEYYGVVSGTSFVSTFSGDGMFKSTDNGASWTPLASTQSGTPQNNLQNGSYDFVQDLAIDPSNTEQDVVLAAVYNGIIRSEDGGDTWTEVLGFSPLESQYVEIEVTSEGVFYAGGSTDGAVGGFWRSADGINWVEITPAEQQLNTMRRVVVEINPMDENEVYFIYDGQTDQNDLGHGLFKYTYATGDGTEPENIWENRSANLPAESCVLNIGVNFEFGQFQSQFSFDLCMTHHPTQDEVLFIGGRNIWRSTDAFATSTTNKWIGGYQCNVENPRDYSYPNHHSDQHRFVFSQDDPNVMFNSNDGGIYKTNDAFADSVEWISLNNGYLTTQFYTVALEQGVAESDFVMGGLQDNGTWLTDSSDPTADWKEIHNDDGAYCAIVEGAEFAIVSSQNGRYYKKLLDEEGNQTIGKRVDPVLGPTSLFINPNLVDPQNHNTLYVAGNKTVWRLQNLDTIQVDGNLISKVPMNWWQSLGTSLMLGHQGQMSALDIPLINNDRIYYGSNNGYAFRLDGLSTGNFVKTGLDYNSMPDDAWVSSISANPLDDEEVMLCMANYSIPSIFHSFDAGETFVDVSGNLEENLDGSGNGPAVYAVEVYPSDPPMYFAGTSIGLYSTMELDGANTVWVQESPEGIGNVIINAITSRPYDGTIAVGTHGNGIYSASIEPVLEVNIDAQAEVSTAVKFYPNPAQETLTIESKAFEANAQLEFKIWNTMGQMVRNEAIIVESGGRLRADVKNLANGQYVFAVRGKGIFEKGNFVKE